MNIERVPPVGPPSANPLSSGGAKHGPTIYSTVVPRRSDGSYEIGDIAAQAHQVFDNLDTTLGELGASLATVLHMTIYLTDLADREGFNEVYAARVPQPFPVRCAVQIAALAVPGMKLEVTVVAATAG